MNQRPDLAVKPGAMRRDRANLFISGHGLTDQPMPTFLAQIAGSLGTPTCDNFPRDARGLIDLVVDPAPWKVAGYDLQKGATPDCFPPSISGQVAALTLVVAQKSSSVSSNLFLGSAAVAGASSAGGILFAP